MLSGWSAVTGTAGKGAVPADARSLLQSAGLLTKCKIVVGTGRAALFGCSNQDGAQPVSAPVAATAGRVPEAATTVVPATPVIVAKA